MLRGAVLNLLFSNRRGVNRPDLLLSFPLSKRKFAPEIHRWIRPASLKQRSCFRSCRLMSVDRTVDASLQHSTSRTRLRCPPGATQTMEGQEGMGNLFAPLSPETTCVQAMVLYRIHRVKLYLLPVIKNKPTTKHHKTKEARNRELIDERASAADQKYRETYCGIER